MNLLEVEEMGSGAVDILWNDLLRRRGEARIEGHPGNKNTGFVSEAFQLRYRAYSRQILVTSSLDNLLKVVCRSWPSKFAKSWIFLAGFCSR